MAIRGPRCRLCGKKLAEEVEGRAVFRCPRCKALNVVEEVVEPSSG